MRVGVRRVGWGFIGQGFASLANFVLSFQGAAYLGARGFGALASTLAVLYIVQACLRAVCGEVYVAAYSAWASDASSRGARDVQAAILLLGGLAAICIAGGALLLPVPHIVQATALAGAVAAGPMFFLDCRRFVLIARGRTCNVAISNLCLLLVQVVGGLGLWSLGDVTPWGLLVLYAGASTVAGLTVRNAPVGLRIGRCGFWWFRHHLRLGRAFLLEALAVNSASQIVLILVTVLISLGATAAIRTATLLLAPLTFLLQGLSQQVVAEMGRVRSTRRWRVSLMVQTLTVTAGAAWVVLVMGVPDGVIRAVVGENGIAATVVLPGMGLYLLASLAALGPNGVLKVEGAVRPLMMIRGGTAPLAVGLPVMIAQVLGSPTAVTYAMGGVNVVTVVLLSFAAFFLHRRVVQSVMTA